MREKKLKRRRRRLEAQGRMVNGVEVPDGAIPADILNKRQRAIAVDTTIETKNPHVSNVTQLKFGLRKIRNGILKL
jgi:hypothetical protein